jgi:glycerophosphoryl diester phosphodiesterase
MFINYAHRGASEYAPENTMTAFCLGLEMGANGIETDIQMTHDGVAVLFHDDNLKRVTGVDAKLGEKTLAQLELIDFGAHIRGAKYKGESIVTLSDFMKYFARRPLHLALELKGPGTERATIEAVEAAGCRARTILTSFEFGYLEIARRLDSGIALSYLTEQITPEVLDRLSAAGIGQICPRAGSFTKDDVAFAKSRGFSVRAWAVADETLMLSCLEAGVDGMTVNFPDRLSLKCSELGIKLL